jgi:hypothetical protein
MKGITTPRNSEGKSINRRLTLLSVLLAILAMNLSADVVYVTSRPQPRGNGPNDDGTYNDNNFGDDTSAKSTAPGVPSRSGSRYFSNSFSNSTPDYGITISPALGLPGMIYQVDHTYSSLAGNVSSNILLSATNVAGCTLSFSTNIDKFQARYGEPAPQSWQLLGYLTNDPGSATPLVTFYFQDGNVSAALEQRLEVDCFRFTSLDPCLTVAAPTVTGPLAANLNNVRVAGVSPGATNVAVYQDSGGGMVRISSLAVTNPQPTISIPVSGLIRGAQVAATQKIKGQESCVPTLGTLVGGGANPSVRVALSIRGNPELAGPVGSTGGKTNANVYFLGASDLLSGACPADSMVLEPATNWQTVTLTRGADSANPIDPVKLWNDGGGAPFSLEGNYGALDGIAFACEGDTGPFELYLDDLANGTNGIIQDWEAGVPGSAFGFVQPTTSGTTSGNLLTSPDESAVATNTAFSGNQSLRVSWQFADGATNLWLRFVTANAVPVENPQIELDEPISFKILLLRPGDPVPPAPGSSPPGDLTIALNGNAVALTWTGIYQLQAGPSITGQFTNVPGITASPYTAVVGTGPTFFRLTK